MPAIGRRFSLPFCISTSALLVWTVLGPLGAQIGEKLNLSPE
jgi:hypothetical protein